MLNSIEHEINHSHKCYKFILSFISIIITTSKSLEKTLLSAFHLAFEISILVDWAWKNNQKRNNLRLGCWDAEQ